MEPLDASELLRDARSRHGISQEALAIRAGTSVSVVAEIESGDVSPKVETLCELLQLLGEDLVLSSEARKTGIDLTLNQGNLELSVGDRVEKGLAFADLVRQNRRGGSVNLGRALQPGALLAVVDRHQVDFVVIGSVAGLAHGSAYPTYDLDLTYAMTAENLSRLTSALGEVGIRTDSQSLGGQNALSFETKFGTLDLVGRIPGVGKYEELRRDSHLEVIAGVPARVASLDHLIAMKRAANRAKDQLMVLEYVELADEIRKREAEEND